MRPAAALALASTLADAPVAFAYIGPSYLRIEGVAGDAKPTAFAGWLRAESNYWTQRPELQEIRGIRDNKNDLLFTGPQAPAHGPDVLDISIDKASPALEPLMALCRRTFTHGAVPPEMPTARLEVAAPPTAWISNTPTASQLRISAATLCGLCTLSASTVSSGWRRASAVLSVM